MNGNFEISKDEVLEILTKNGRYSEVGVIYNEIEDK